MTKLRITNKAKGGRGVWIMGELVEISPGSTRTFADVRAEEVKALSTADFRVRTSDDGEVWEDVGEVEDVAQRPWLVIASDNTGTAFRHIPLQDGEWFVGTAVASEQPEKAGEFSYTKIGGSSAPLTEEAAVASHEFDAAAYLDQNGNTVIASLKDKPREVLEALLEAEKSDGGKKRKGVVAALEDALTEPEPEGQGEAK